MIRTALDKAMDWTVVPGYSRLGYAVRKRFWGEAGEQALSGWTILLTGASSGLGAAACERFARAGANVHMLVRSRDRGEQVKREIAERTGSSALELELCDISNLEAVRGFAREFNARVGELHVLVNNAGVMPSERTQTDEGFELTFATNVLGPFLLTNLLLPALRRGAPSRIINVTSGGMYTARLQPDDLQLEQRDYDPPAFYAHTKRCEVILTELWSERLRGSGITAHSMHPGWADTPGVQTSLPRFRKLMRPLLRSADEGADTIVWLAGAPEAAEKSGSLWHDRAVRPLHRVPWTRESAEERQRLWDECARLTGWSEADAAASESGATSGRSNSNEGKES